MREFAHLGNGRHVLARTLFRRDLSMDLVPKVESVD
jgi:hypothetical protein